MDNRPIGVFDSGVGGVSVLLSLTALLPAEDFIYYGDTANAPYGVKPEAEIRDLALAAANALLGENIKALVIACNTATSAAAVTLRERLAMPVIGLEPALKPASLAPVDGQILVMATPATLRQAKFRALYERYGAHAELVPCPGLMEFAERLELDSPALDQYLETLLAPFKARGKVGAAVLGCTHYVFLKRAIARALPGALLFDGNDGAARRLRDLLDAGDLRAVRARGSVAFRSSDPEALPMMRKLYESRGGEVENE